MKITRVAPKSVAKISAFMYALLGLIGGVFFFLLSVGVFAGGGGMGALFFALLSPIIFAVLYGLMGFVLGYVMAWLYNFAAKRVGGIEFDTE